MGTMYRVQILLEPEQHQALTEIAEREGRSLSDLVREIVRQHLAGQDQEARLLREIQAIEDLTQIRKQVQEQYGVLSEVREEWEQDSLEIGAKCDTLGRNRRLV